MSLSRGLSRSQRIARDPCVDARQTITQMVVLGDAVSLARIEHELGRLASILQAAKEFVRLTGRHALVASAMQDERWGLDVVDERHRRSRVVQRGRLPVDDAAEVTDQ